jgi:hypothetical protein
MPCSTSGSMQIISSLEHASPVPFWLHSLFCLRECLTSMHAAIALGPSQLKDTSREDRLQALLRATETSIATPAREAMYRSGQMAVGQQTKTTCCAEQLVCVTLSALIQYNTQTGSRMPVLEV